MKNTQQDVDRMMKTAFWCFAIAFCIGVWSFLAWLFV
jgi:hypothetical protein